MFAATGSSALAAPPYFGIGASAAPLLRIDAFGAPSVEPMKGDYASNVWQGDTSPGSAFQPEFSYLISRWTQLDGAYVTYGYKTKIVTAIHFDGPPTRPKMNTYRKLLPADAKLVKQGGAAGVCYGWVYKSAWLVKRARAAVAAKRLTMSLPHAWSQVVVHVLWSSSTSSYPASLTFDISTSHDTC